MSKKQIVEKSDFDSKLEALEKKYGMKRSSPEELTIVSTGSLQLDVAMKIGGTAVGKMIELMGPESSGKSTLTLHQISEYQKAFPEKKVALFDYENSYDEKYAESIGVDIDSLLIYQPSCLEEGYDMILGLIENDLVSCVVIDSQTAAAPKAIIEGEMGDATISLQARMNSKFCLKVKGLLTIHKATLFIISQTRSNIGSNSGDISTGGNAIKFYSDVRWKIWKSADKTNELNKTTIDVIKSKIGKPFGQAKLNILWGVGISKIDEVIEYAEELGFIEVGGSWYTIEGVKLQGMNKVREFMQDNPEYFEELSKRVREAVIPKGKLVEREESDNESL